MINLMSHPERTPDATDYLPLGTESVPRTRVLIIEDHVDTGVWLGRALQEQGYAVRWERRGEHALIALERPPFPDAIILDLLLPGLHGERIYKLVRGQKDLEKTPILVITAVPDQELPGWDDAWVGTLTKPVSKRQILQALEGLLAR